ncbi:uncharacterized protein [Amphiura filiformis]|uniref:uncharacterized protein n=1 Tax=Amphiura filiformis TaxID=82378 RepID=UPI003B228B4F
MEFLPVSDQVRSFIRGYQEAVSGRKREKYRGVTEESERSFAKKEVKWKREGNKRQFEFNQSILELIEESIEKPIEADQSLRKALGLLRDRQKLIKLAEQSEHGWTTVAEYETNELAEDEDDEKRIMRAEARAGRKIKQKQQARKPPKRFKRDVQSTSGFTPRANPNPLFLGNPGMARF